ncbi:hypothetical protein [Spirosoma lituiforme]
MNPIKLLFGSLFCLVILSKVKCTPPPMFKMDYDIQIGKVKLKGIESVTVDSSADLLSDQCKITLPGMAYNKAYDLEKVVKRGDAVTVKLGYDGNLHTEFKGYLKSIHPNTPMKLECEDSIYLFRKPIKDKQFKKTTAIDILQYVISQINPQLTGHKMKLVTDLSGLQFDSFTIVRANGYEVLEKIKSETGVAIYCRNDELHCHLLYTQKRGDVTYDFAKNLEESDGLEYVRAEDVKVLVKVVGRTKKGANIEVEVGEKGGDVRTFQKPTISDKATLEAVGKEELKKLSFDGYKGAVKGWLIPVCEIGYSAKLIDKDYPEREGRYYVNAVKTEFSSSGGRRTVTLGIKVSA